MDEVSTTLADREGKYGSYIDQSQTSEDIIAVMESSVNWSELPAPHKQALRMIALKAGRILNGDINDSDSWHDIQGYAKLVHREIEMDAPLELEQDTIEVLAYLSTADVMGDTHPSLVNRCGEEADRVKDELLRRCEELRGDGVTQEHLLDGEEHH